MRWIGRTSAPWYGPNAIVPGKLIPSVYERLTKRFIFFVGRGFYIPGAQVGGNSLAARGELLIPIERFAEQTMMTITIDPETEARIQTFASRAGLQMEDYVRAALIRQMEWDEQHSKADTLDTIFQVAAVDPLFMQDLMDTEQAFATADSQTSADAGP